MHNSMLLFVGRMFVCYLRCVSFDLHQFHMVRPGSAQVHVCLCCLSQESNNLANSMSMYDLAPGADVHIGVPDGSSFWLTAELLLSDHGNEEDATAETVEEKDIITVDVQAPQLCRSAQAGHAQRLLQKATVSPSRTRSISKTGTSSRSFSRSLSASRGPSSSPTQTRSTSECARV